MRTLSGSRARCAHDLIAASIGARAARHRACRSAELLRDVEDACPSSAWSSVPTDAKTASETGARAESAFASPSSIVAGTSMGAFYSSRRAGKSRLDASLVAIDVALGVPGGESHAKFEPARASLRWERACGAHARAPSCSCGTRRCRPRLRLPRAAPAPGRLARRPFADGQSGAATWTRARADGAPADRPGRAEAPRNMAGSQRSVAALLWALVATTARALAPPRSGRAAPPRRTSVAVRGTLKPYLSTLIGGDGLSFEESRSLFGAFFDGTAAPEEVAAVLCCLRQKGESFEEVAGAATAMRDACVRVDAPGTLLDIVGTGGDGACTINLSTCSAILAAACGAKVTNVVIGVFDEALVELLGAALERIGVVDHAVVIHGVGLDELSPPGPARSRARDGDGYASSTWTLDPLDYGMPRCTLADLTTLDDAACRDAIALNAGMGLYVYGAAPDLKAGIALAKDGRVARASQLDA
ncbi:anthranilate phosphoribosyltransferase [Aureococcus anophagefferens]|nr:anthranilate phosphoribosyltransferase [Aureococcus anophagefferens]